MVLLSVDKSQTVLGRMNSHHSLQASTYTVYGHCQKGDGLLGFNGEKVDRLIKNYMLGNGYRMFCVNLMRFNSPDDISPFDSGGLNAYSYCMGDPVNLTDASGHAPKRSSSTSFNFDRYRQAVMGTYKVTGVPRTRSNSLPSLTDRPAQGHTPKGWDLIGFHASSIENGASLKLGLDPKFIGSNLGGEPDFGQGFYLAVMKYLTGFVGAYIRDVKGKTPGLYGVYVENMARLKQGRDFNFGQLPEYPSHRREMEVVIREPAYPLIAVRSLREGDTQVVLPRSKEAPF
ncbi:RHS repeat-associated core domain-containing protein [Pseudomonas peradeniyensis]|uniref:RHS repeat-associated core domain-containing protein n=2 Tax=Pseudomonas TaxID=286 RepID=A0ABT2VFR9_9PSED|nr:RHS repeat-associated core domain-containing protein [Pseudomonas peradeniyensis]MCU7240560.1 RHS repeat-associated core domain-containing protein [Pseudomonas peradeniyensis]